jgi:thiol:disulfide interchange protein
MPSVHGILNLIMLAVTVWCYWRILGKAGLSGWWAYLLVLTLAILFLSSITRSPMFLFAPYIMPAILIWIFAFVRWPSFEAAARAEGDKRFAAMDPDRRDDMPSADPHRRVNPRFRNGDADRGRRRGRNPEK